MSNIQVKSPNSNDSINNLSSGVKGLDLVLNGGFIQGHAIIVRGASGSGKTALGLLFASAVQPDEGDGVSVVACFDESPDALQHYLRNWGKDAVIKTLDLRPDVEEITSAGGYELSGLLVRVENIIRKHKAKRLVLDALDVLFHHFENSHQVRLDILRLFRRCKEMGVTLMVTLAEGVGYEESRGDLDYASDCTLRVYQTLDKGLMTRKLRVLKLRGKGHGTNEYPFMIDERGISMIPITGTNTTYKVTDTLYPTGNKDLDSMLDGGLYGGSTILISGVSGCGKTVLSSTLAGTFCDSGKKVIYSSFEESASQLIRDGKSIGLDLDAHHANGHLHFECRRSVERGLEEHIIHLLQVVEEQQPQLLILDPISALDDLGDEFATKSAILRMCHFLKERGITMVMTELIPDSHSGFSQLNISSLIDTWIRVRNIENNGEFTRLIYVHKSRGRNVANQVKEFRITDRGLVIDDVFLASGKMAVGTERKMLEANALQMKKLKQKEINNIQNRISVLRKMEKVKHQQQQQENQLELIALEEKAQQLANDLQNIEELIEVASIARGNHKGSN